MSNNFLITIMLAIKNVVLDLNANGALGPNGFWGHFYQFFWNIVTIDVILSVQEFFSHWSYSSQS